MNPIAPTSRTALKRHPERGEFDRTVIDRILDEGFFCHLGFIQDGQPFVLPTGYARIKDRLYIHGSTASRMLRTVAGGIDICLTVTLIDGLVLARSAYSHSMNYRSVVALGKAFVVDDPEEKRNALHAFTEQVIPGRWADVREPDEQEMKATMVLCLPLTEVSAKIRSGPPIDQDLDLTRPVWAGVLPLTLTPGTPIPDSGCLPGLEVPLYVKNYKPNR